MNDFLNTSFDRGNNTELVEVLLPCEGGTEGLT